MTQEITITRVEALAALEAIEALCADEGYTLPAIAAVLKAKLEPKSHTCSHCGSVSDEANMTNMDGKHWCHVHCQDSWLSYQDPATIWEVSMIHVHSTQLTSAARGVCWSKIVDNQIRSVKAACRNG